jgi:hypothetical protein
MIQIPLANLFQYDIWIKLIKSAREIVIAMRPKMLLLIPILLSLPTLALAANSSSPSLYVMY